MKGNIVQVVILIIFAYTLFNLYTDVFTVEFDLLKFVAMVLVLLGTCLYIYSILKKLNSKSK